MGSYNLTWHGVGSVYGELPADVARRGWCSWGVTSGRGTAWTVFVGSYQLTWHGVSGFSGVCGELPADVARRGRCLWAVTS